MGSKLRCQAPYLMVICMRRADVGLFPRSPPSNSMWCDGRPQEETVNLLLKFPRVHDTRPTVVRPMGDTRAARKTHTFLCKFMR